MFAAGVAIGFFAIWWNGWRTTGVEVLGGKIWWNGLRPVHGALWAVFAVMAWTVWKRYAWMVLLVDVGIGLGAFLWNRAFHVK